MIEGIEQPAMARRGIAKRLYGLLLRPEASVFIVTMALVIYFELANQNFLTNVNVQTLSQFVAAHTRPPLGSGHNGAGELHNNVRCDAPARKGPAGK